VPVIAEIRATDAASLREIAMALDTRGIQTVRGGRWSAVQVSRVLTAMPSV
jgi:Recombinase